MAQWEAVRRTKQQVKGVDPIYSGLIMVEVTLTPSPPPEWVALWNPYPPNSSHSLSYGPPRVSGNLVTLRVPENKVKTAVEALDGQIAAANDWYDKEVLPQIQAAEDRREREKEEEERRLEAARRQLAELN